MKCISVLVFGLALYVAQSNPADVVLLKIGEGITATSLVRVVASTEEYVGKRIMLKGYYRQALSAARCSSPKTMRVLGTGSRRCGSVRRRQAKTSSTRVKDCHHCRYLSIHKGQGSRSPGRLPW